MHHSQWAKSRGVLLEASSPLGGTWKAKETLELSVVRTNMTVPRLTAPHTPLVYRSSGPAQHHSRTSCAFVA